MLTAAGEHVRFRTRKHFALLIRLALEPGKQFTRDYLADLLWPEAPPKLANHSLAQGLSVIKAKIAREAVSIQRATVGLAPGWIEADATRLGSSDVAINGTFLDGFEIPAARPFEEWKEEHRARLIPQMRDCLVRQMDAARRIGDFPTVERHATRLQELDHLAEEAIRGIMEARAWASDRSGALKAFARYESQLAEELNAKPSADLVRMADLLRDGRRAPRPAVPGYPPERVDRRFEPETLIGREREFSVLYDAWLEARRKQPRIVVVTSDPGVGKTTLVNAFASSCQMDGAVVARAQAYDAERELPFAVLGELVKQLATQRAIGSADPEALSELTRISSEILKAFPGVPKPVDWSPELMPLRIADAFLKTVSAAAIDSPVLLVVDDLHSADNASTAILHSVARKLTDARVLLVLTGRTSELRLSGAPWTLASDTTIHNIQSLELETLSTESGELLVRRLATAAEKSDPPIERILRAAGGNPLAVELLTREWSDHSVGSLLCDLEALNTQPVPVIGIPRAIAVVFERQSRRLDPRIRAALDLAAVLGRRLTELPLYSAIDLSAGEAAEALSRLHDEAYLREVSGELEFRNELIRAQAYYAVPAAVRQHLHRRVAESLSNRQPQCDKTVSLEIAWHHLRGGDVNRAVSFAVEGADAVLAVGAPHGAEEILTALIHLDRNLRQDKKIQLLLARALIDQSKAEPALPIIEKLAAEETLTPNQKAEVAMLRASAEFSLSRTQYSRATRIALSAAKKTNNPQLIAKALFECARAGMEEGDIDLLNTTEHEIQELAGTVDLDSIPMAILSRAYARFFLGDPSESRNQLQRALRVSKVNANAAQLSLLHSALGISNQFVGDLEEAYKEHLVSLELALKVGDDSRTCTTLSNLCTLQMSRGYYEEAIHFGKMGIHYGEACSCSTLLIAYTNLIDPYILVGNEKAATECLEKATKWIGPERRWKLRVTFLIESASFALIQRNIGLAIDLIGQLETLSHDREIALQTPGSYWKLKAFRMAQVGQADEAHLIVTAFANRWKDTCAFPYLDMIATKAWLERMRDGESAPETLTELAVFGRLGAIGKRELLMRQGFLEPTYENLNQISTSTTHQS